MGFLYTSNNQYIGMKEKGRLGCGCGKSAMQCSGYNNQKGRAPEPAQCQRQAGHSSTQVRECYQSWCTRTVTMTHQYDSSVRGCYQSWCTRTVSSGGGGGGGGASSIGGAAPARSAAAALPVLSLMPSKSLIRSPSMN